MAVVYRFVGLSPVVLLCSENLAWTRGVREPELWSAATVSTSDRITFRVVNVAAIRTCFTSSKIIDFACEHACLSVAIDVWRWAHIEPAVVYLRRVRVLFYPPRETTGHLHRATSWSFHPPSPLRRGTDIDRHQGSPQSPSHAEAVVRSIICFSPTWQWAV